MTEVLTSSDDLLGADHVDKIEESKETKARRLNPQLMLACVQVGIILGIVSR